MGGNKSAVEFIHQSFPTAWFLQTTHSISSLFSSSDFFPVYLNLALPFPSFHFLLTLSPSLSSSSFSLPPLFPLLPTTLFPSFSFLPSPSLITFTLLPPIVLPPSLPLSPFSLPLLSSPLPLPSPSLPGTASWKTPWLVVTNSWKTLSSYTSSGMTRRTRLGGFERDTLWPPALLWETFSLKCSLLKKHQVKQYPIEWLLEREHSSLWAETKSMVDIISYTLYVGTFAPVVVTYQVIKGAVVQLWPLPLALLGVDTLPIRRYAMPSLH